MTALNRAVAFAQVDAIAMIIGQYLNFDVAWRYQCLFENQFIVVKTGKGFGTCECKCLFKLCCVSHQPHAPATTSCSGLDHHRIAYRLCCCSEGTIRLISTVIAR